MKDPDGESYVKVFNKLQAEMALADSFHPPVLVHSHFSVKIDLASIYLSLSETSPSPSSVFSHQPVGVVWIGCSRSASPRLLSGTNFKKAGWKIKKMEGKILWRERESVSVRQRILSHRGASSIIQMAAVPLHLFSLLGLNNKMAALQRKRYAGDEAHAESSPPSSVVFLPRLA